MIMETNIFVIPQEWMEFSDFLGHRPVIITCILSAGHVFMCCFSSLLLVSYTMHMQLE